MNIHLKLEFVVNKCFVQYGWAYGQNEGETKYCESGSPQRQFWILSFAFKF